MSALDVSQKSEKSMGTILSKYPCVKTFIWNIPDYNNLSQARSYFIDSPNFYFGGMLWYLRIYPNGRRYDYTEMYLLRDNATAKDCFVKFSLGIRKADGTDYKTVNVEYNFSKTMGFGVDDLETRSTVRNTAELVIRDTNGRHFFCTLQLRDKQSKEVASQCVQTEALEALLQNLKEFLGGEDADVIFKVKDEDFKAHKNFLKVRSPVFKSMFGHNMKEKKSNVIEVSDCDPTAFRDFLHFVYCGKVEELSVDTVFNLYFIADKYDVKELRNICVEFIVDNMSIDTFFEAMNIALRHDEQTLLKHATNCFVQNSTEIAETARWLLFLEDNHVAANELFLKALKSLKIKLSAEN